MFFVLAGVSRPLLFAVFATTFGDGVVANTATTAPELFFHLEIGYSLLDIGYSKNRAICRLFFPIAYLPTCPTSRVHRFHGLKTDFTDFLIKKIRVIFF